MQNKMVTTTWPGLLWGLLLLATPVNVTHISDISDLITNIQRYRDPSCVMERRSDVVRCFIPVDGKMVPAANDLVHFPKHSSCRLKGGNPKIPRCITCVNSAWKTTACHKGLRREKRWFWWICVFFCRRSCGSGGSRSNHSPPKMKSCEGPETPIVADLGLTSTTVTWKIPSAVDGKGNPTQTKGLQPGSVFQQGHYTISYKATDSKGYSDSCSFAFEVKVPRCFMLWIRHASRVCDSGELIHGKKCQLICHDGYDLVGAAEVTCQQDGSWSSDLPTCKPKTCPDLTNFTCTDNYNYGSICSLSCNTSAGFSVTNDSITTCLKTGQWFHPMPQCIDSAAPVFDNCPSESLMLFADKGSSLTAGWWGNITATDNSGNATVTQVDGLQQGSMFPSGSTVVKYKATDPSGNAALCRFNIVVQILTCSPPSTKDNKMSFQCTNDYTYGSECAIECKGSMLNGSNLMTCEKKNTAPPSTVWEYNGTPPFCEERPCPDLEPPKNGALACDANSISSFCTMHCNDKYDVPYTVKDMYACAYTTGKWRPSTTFPDCTVRHRPGSASQQSEMMYYSGECGDEDTMQIIKEEHVQAMQSSNFADVCLGAECSVENVDVSCWEDVRKKREADARYGIIIDPETYIMTLQSRNRRSTTAAVIVKWETHIPFDCGEMSNSDCMDHHRAILKPISAVITDLTNNGHFQNLVPGYETRVDESFYPGGMDLVCGEGMWPNFQTASCAVCPTGTVYNATLDDCSTCPEGFYQDGDHSFSCKPCPQGSTTLEEGSRSRNDCLAYCTPGHVSLYGVEPCAPCRIGEYHPSGDGTECLTCPLGTTTQTTAATDSQQCLSYEMAVEGPCSLTTDNQLSDAMNDFTLIMWLKMKSEVQMSVKVTEASAGDQLEMSIGDLISVSIHGCVLKQGSEFYGYTTSSLLI